jgi:Kef-type K+ transport system membrane component KefB/nucleotide-binding universal stress UspA family protein
MTGFLQTEDVTLGLAVLLAAGMLAAKAGQMLKLPSVTGYIVAGMLLGPSGFGIVTPEIMGSKLHHFTQIALMLIAFGIGELLEVKRLRQSAGSIAFISGFEAAGALVFVWGAIFFVTRLYGFDRSDWGIDKYLVTALLVGTVAVATAPASTLHILRELKAKGPLTSMLMAVVAIDNGLAIIFFALAMSLAGQIAAGSGSLTGALFGSVLEIFFSLSAGLLTGLLISFVLHHLKRKDEMLTAGLALLLLCGEGCRYFHLSPLLAGMAAGFTVINRVTRDVRLFRALNAFEPPVYVLFFTLAGSHLDLSSLGQAGWIGLVYYSFRIIGKYSGAYLGAFFTGAPVAVRNYLGGALMPQAEMAIGLIFLLNSDENLAAFSAIITPIVLAGVVLSELSGPICARLAVEKAGESGECAGQEQQDGDKAKGKGESNGGKRAEDFSLVPWAWGKLSPHPIPDGVVAFGAKQSPKVTGLARMATIIAHHYNAVPMSVRVVKPQSREYLPLDAVESLFCRERDEVENLGYELSTELVQDNDIASGLVAAVEYNDARAVVLGCPIEGTFQSFQEILEKVAKNVACPVVLVRFCGEMHTERILVPVRDLEELDDVGPIVHALSRVGDHQLTILYLLSADEPDERVEFKKQQLAEWVQRLKIAAEITFQIEKTEARQETILKESEKHDLVVMGTSKKNVLKKMFFGSLVETVFRRIRKPLLIVYRPANEPLLADRGIR